MWCKYIPSNKSDYWEKKRLKDKQKKIDSWN